MDSLNAVLFVLLIAGHTTIWITLVNRLHALPLPCDRLRQLRHIHDVAIPVFPLTFIWFVGLTGPKLLLGGSWGEVNGFWMLLLGISALGTVWLAYVVLRTLTRRPATPQRSNHSEIHDVAAELGHKPIGPGPYRILATLPFNEQFQVEFNEKSFELARLPREWDGLTILHLSDWHLCGTVAKEFFVRVCEIAARAPVDLVCFTGDLLDNQSLVAWLPETLGLLSGRVGKYFILGNHDWYQRPEETRAALMSLGWEDASADVRRLPFRGRSLELGGDETPWMGRPSRFSEHADFRLLLSHSPDHFLRARRQGVDLMLSGHTHGGQVQFPVIGPVYSPSRYGCKYSSGTFWTPPTLMHVSRGISGQHPLRWRCPPEVTRIVLRSPRNS